MCAFMLFQSNLTQEPKYGWHTGCISQNSTRLDVKWLMCIRKSVVVAFAGIVRRQASVRRQSMTSGTLKKIKTGAHLSTKH